MIPASSIKILEKFPYKKPILIEGENLYEMEAVLDLIRRRATEEGIETIETFHGDEITWGGLSDEVSTGMLFGERLIIIRHTENIREDSSGNDQETVLKKPAPGAYFVFLAEKLDQRKKTTKLLISSCSRIPCVLPGKDRIPDWIIAFARSHGYSIDRAAADLTATLMENNPLRITSEMQKVFMYAGDRKKIGEDDIASCLSFSRDEKPWSVAEHLLLGDIESALLSVKRLRDAGSHPAVVLVLVSRQMKKTYEIADLREKGLAPNAVIRRMKLNPYMGQKDIDLARRYSKEKLGEAFAVVVRTEALMKSVPVDDRLLLESMIFEIHEILRARGR